MKQKVTIAVQQVIQTVAVQVESQNIEVEICQRLGDWGFDYTTQKTTPKYHAQIKSAGGFWGCGNSMDEAVGSLIRNHPEKFGLTFTWLGKQHR